MNEPQITLREQLRRAAGEPGVRSMPPGTLRQVRGREARSIAGLLVLVAVVAVAVAWLLRLLPNPATTPASGGRLPSHPLEAVPSGWPEVRIGDPSTAYVPPVGPDAVGEVHVIASGTVGGSAFSLVGWTANGNSDAGPCLDLAGPGEPGGDAFSGGEMGACDDGYVGHAAPRDVDIDLLGFTGAPSLGLEANYGYLSERVVRLEAVMDDGSTATISILDGPDGWNVRAFLLFPPPGASGHLVAYDGEGRALARALLCVNDGIAGGCRTTTEQLVPPTAQGS